MVAPILLGVSFISTGVFTFLYLKEKGERKDLEAKFKATRDYAENLAKSTTNLERKNKELSHKLEEVLAKNLVAKAHANAISNGVSKPVTDNKKPRRNKNNNK